MRRLLPFALLLAGGCTAPAPPVPAPTVLTISPQPQQTIEGWGIYPCTIQNDRPDAPLYTLWNRPQASRLIWHELGISFWRCEILPGSYDAKRDDGSLDEAYLRGSLERQLQLGASFGPKPYILSIWSPPAVFKWRAPNAVARQPDDERQSGSGARLDGQSRQTLGDGQNARYGSATGACSGSVQSAVDARAAFD